MNLKSTIMKSIFYLFITVVLSLTSSFVMHNSSGSAKSYILQSTGNNITSALLTQSAEIISARLKFYGLDEFDVRAIPEKGQIKVQLADNIQISDIEGLLVSRGDLAFYETSGSNNLSDLLKSNNAGKPLLVRSDVESINCNVDKDSQNAVTQIKFKPAAVRIWAEATRRNINKPIAIVVDDQIYFTPVVRDAIENGACEITGDLSQKEVGVFLVLVNNEPLQLSFTLLK
jgi:preprotein translocase subunit SecD